MTTLALFVHDSYLPHIEANLKPRTVAEYRRLLDKTIVPDLGRKQVHKLTTRDVDQWHLAQRKMAPIQANRALAVLSGALTLAARWGDIPVNPAQGVQMAREQPRDRYLTSDEVERLKAALKRFSAQESAFILTMLYTGARPGELISARWEWIAGSRLELPDSKTGRRTVFLPKPARGAMAAIPGIGQTSGLIFPDVNPTTLWRRLRVAAGLEGCRLYDLRHTFASAALEARVSLEAVGQLLGHSKTQTTRRYVHLAPRVGDDAAEKIAAVLN